MEESNDNTTHNESVKSTDDLTKPTICIVIGMAGSGNKIFYFELIHFFFFKKGKTTLMQVRISFFFH